MAMSEASSIEDGGFTPQRRKAALVLLSVTLVWGGTFIWMKQALNALTVELDVYGTFPVVALLVGGRFAIAMVLVFALFPSARKGLNKSPIWKGGGVLGGLMLVGFVSQMVALNEINPSTSAFLTSLYVVMTAVLTTRMTGDPGRRSLYWGVLMATLGAGFIEGPPHLSWGWGELVTVACALFFALHIIYTQHWTLNHDPLQLTLTSFIVVSGGSMLLALPLFWRSMGHGEGCADNRRGAAPADAPRRGRVVLLLGGAEHVSAAHAPCSGSHHLRV